MMDLARVIEEIESDLANNAAPNVCAPPSEAALILNTTYCPPTAPEDARPLVILESKLVVPTGGEPVDRQCPDAELIEVAAQQPEPNEDTERPVVALDANAEPEQLALDANAEPEQLANAEPEQPVVDDDAMSETTASSRDWAQPGAFESDQLDRMDSQLRDKFAQPDLEYELQRAERSQPGYWLNRPPGSTVRPDEDDGGADVVRRVFDNFHRDMIEPVREDPITRSGLAYTAPVMNRLLEVLLLRDEEYEANAELRDEEYEVEFPDAEVELRDEAE